MTKEEFKKRRLALGLSQAKIAPYFGIKTRQLQNIEYGTYKVPANAEFIFRSIKLN